MNQSRKSATVLIALGAALATPFAFAQSSGAPTSSSDPAAQSQSAPPGSAPTSGAPTTAPAPAADAKKVTWADLDGDKDGKLTKTEAAPLDSLTKIFDQADSNADGSLTADEYKAFLAKNGKAPGSQGG